MTLFLGLLIIAATVLAILRRVDVRLALLLAALALGIIASDAPAIVRTFLSTFSDSKFVVPICSAMGFAHVLRHTGCDRHLIHLLVRPLQHVRPLLVPGAVVVGFLVNIPIISQTSTAVAVGTVLVPLMLAARVSPITTGAALLLGSSLGGELLNPGAPELNSVSSALQKAGLAVNSSDCVEHVLPLVLVQLGLATVLFWIWSAWADRTNGGDSAPAAEPLTEEPEFRVNLLKAAVPVLPLVLLFMTALPHKVFEVPKDWLVVAGEKPGTEDSRLIGAAMLAGVVAALVTSPRALSGVGKAFFEGAGYAFTHIIAIIVAASCFGKGVELIGLAALLGGVIEQVPALLLPSAGVLPLSFGWVSGSGMAATQSLFEKFYIAPALALEIDPLRVGAVVSIAAAAGRTMSPVAAVTLMCASMSGTDPLALARRVAVPLLVGTVAVVVVAMALSR